MTILQNLQKGIMLCQDSFKKFKINRYYTKSGEIHLGLGVM